MRTEKRGDEESRSAAVHFIRVCPVLYVLKSSGGCLFPSPGLNNDNVGEDNSTP